MIIMSIINKKTIKLWKKIQINRNVKNYNKLYNQEIKNKQFNNFSSFQDVILNNSKEGNNLCLIDKI